MALAHAESSSSRCWTKLVDRDPVLAHRVAVAHRHRPIVEGVEVDRHAERRADLVLTAVAPADGAGVVDVDHEPGPQQVGDLVRDRVQPLVARQRQHRDRIGASRGSSRSSVRFSPRTSSSV